MKIDDSRDSRSDQFLVQAMNRGDTQAFEALYYRYRDWVTTMARRFTGHDDDALDVLQETFAYLLRKFPRFRLESQLTTFLYPVVKHLSIAASKKRRRLVLGGDKMLPEGEATPELNRDESRSELEVLVRDLPEGQRDVLLLRYVDDLSLDEIATLLHIPTGTVKSRVHNALKTLREDPEIGKYFGA